MKALTLDELVAQSTDIVRASRVSKSSHYDDYNQIVTDYVFSVSHKIKGRKVVGTTLIVRSLGGVVGELGMHVAGEPQFEQGQEYLLFLRGFRNHHRAVGMTQGVMPVAKLKGVSTVFPGGAGASLVQPIGGKLKTAKAALTAPTKTRGLVSRIKRIERKAKRKIRKKSRR